MHAAAARATVSCRTATPSTSPAQGASPEGDRPFLDRLNLKTLQDRAPLPVATTTATKRSSRLLDDDGADGADALRDAERAAELLRARHRAPARSARSRSSRIRSRSFTASSGSSSPTSARTASQLSGTLYLPPGYKQGERRAGDHVGLSARVRRRRRRQPGHRLAEPLHRRSRGASHLFLLTQGYAIFDDPTMPIVGPGETANDTYVEQLVASAQAAVDKVVEMGVADRDRIGVGGHSYGAFMTANLLAHSRPLPRRHRAQRRLQPHADAVRLPERDAHVLGGAGDLRARCRRSATPTRSTSRSC